MVSDLMVNLGEIGNGKLKVWEMSCLVLEILDYFLFVVSRCS